ncbi:class I SAM-dependent methyltransferase [Priestia megaterium]|nr:class I SAM-dependent methyltransferase [Priestia megaterium]
MFNRWLGKQLSNPKGMFSKWVGTYMAKGNQQANQWTISLLQAAPEDCILEVGTGNGTAIHSILEKNKAIENVYGIDISASMVKEAMKLNETFIRNNRAEIMIGSVESIPYETESFTKVYTIHTVYFWPDIEKGLREIHRVLKPEGRVFMTFTLSDQLQQMNHTKNFSRYSPHDLERLLEKTGFSHVDINTQTPFCCISAEK